MQTFGGKGENVFDPEQEEVALETTTDREKHLHPIEIFEIKGPIQLVRAASTVPLLVSGDGHAWPELSVAGLLDRTGPIRYTDDVSNTTLAEALDDGAPLAITDTNRRRIERSAAATPRRRIRTPSGPVSGCPNVRCARCSPRRQPVRGVVPDATDVVASGFGRPLGRARPSFRPALASTVTRRRRGARSTLEEDGAGQWVRVDLRRPTRSPRCPSLGAHVPEPAAGEARDDLVLGRQRAPDRPRLRSGHGRSTVRARLDEVRARRDRRCAPAEGVVSPGLSEITIPGLDLREHIQLPIGVLARAQREPALLRLRRGRTAAVPLRCPPQDEARPVEPSIGAEVRTIDDRSFVLDGTLGSQTQVGGGRCRTGLPAVDGVDVPVRSTGSGGRGVCADRPPARLAHAATRLPSGRRSSRRNWPPGQWSARPPGGRASSTTSRSRPARGQARGPASVIVAPSWTSGRATPPTTTSVTAIELDTLSGWTVDRDGGYDFDAHVGAQTTYVVALVVSLLAVGAYVWLVISRAAGTHHERADVARSGLSSDESDGYARRPRAGPGGSRALSAWSSRRSLVAVEAVGPRWVAARLPPRSWWSPRPRHCSKSDVNIAFTRSARWPVTRARSPLCWHWWPSPPSSAVSVTGRRSRILTGLPAPGATEATVEPDTAASDRIPHWWLVGGAALIVAVVAAPAARAAVPRQRSTCSSTTPLPTGCLGLLVRGTRLRPACRTSGGLLLPDGAVVVLGDLFGLAPWITERLWIALLLVLAWWGTARLADELEIGTPPTRVVGPRRPMHSPRSSSGRAEGSPRSCREARSCRG